jgi:hypothetical protein
MFRFDDCYRNALLAIGLTAFAASAIAAPPPIDAFATEPEFDNPVLSPDGRKIGYITSGGGKRVFAILDLDKSQLRPVIPAESETFLLSWCKFKTDERLLCSYRSHAFDAGRPYWVTRLVGVNADGSKQKVMIQNGFAGV